MSNVPGGDRGGFWVAGFTGRYRPAIDQKKGKAKHWNLARLSSRERQVLQMLAEGHAVGNIATALSLSPKTVDVMTTNQSGTLVSQSGLGFGLGFQTTDRLGADGLASVGTYGWGGAYGSTYKVDPAERLVIVFMINQLPNRTDVAAKFPTLVYQALVEPRVVVGARAP